MTDLKIDFGILAKLIKKQKTKMFIEPLDEGWTIQISS